MPSRHPRLPAHRPLAIAHRGGNSLTDAHAAIRVGADMLEADIWNYRGKLEIRHKHRAGPILWERWALGKGWGHQLTLRELLEGTPDDAFLFLDLKGREIDLGPRIMEELQTTAPDRRIAACGRNYPQMDLLRDQPNVTLFYSVGETKEWPQVWPRLEAMKCPALSLKLKLATPEVMRRLRDMDATVVCWGVETEADLDRLDQLDIDGATTDHGALIALINEQRTAG